MRATSNLGPGCWAQLLLAGLALPFLGRAWQGIFQQRTSTSTGRAGWSSSPGTTMVTGSQAVYTGLINLLVVLLLCGAIYGIWHFWQRKKP